MIKKIISVTSHALDAPCHKLSHLLWPLPSRAWLTLWTAPNNYLVLHGKYMQISSQQPSWGKINAEKLLFLADNIRLFGFNYW